MMIWKYKSSKETLKMQSKQWPFFHLVQLSAPISELSNDHYTHMRAGFIYQFSTMLLHALVAFTKQVDILLKGNKQKNRSGSAIYPFPAFWRIGIHILVFISK